MLAAVIISSLAAVVMLVLYILLKSEIKNLTNELRELKDKNTNTLLHSVNSSESDLINEINNLLKEMRENKAEYSRKNHALEQMMTNISHDLRTPLTSAMGYISIIRSSDLPEEEKSRELAIIEKRLIRLEELIDSFFEFSQIVSSGKPPEKTKLNLVSVLEESIVHYYDDYCAQNRQIIFSCDKSKILIHSNYNMLMRIFDNLIGNALKHGKGDLSLSVNSADNLQITFKNELVISDIDVERVFEEFYTTDISRTKGNTGLGLAIAKQFTETLGGRITAEQANNLFSITISFVC